MSIHHFKSYEALRSLKSALKSCSEAIECSSRPHMYETALWEVNAALRHLTHAQFRLMQAKMEYRIEREKNGLDKN